MNIRQKLQARAIQLQNEIDDLTSRRGKKVAALVEVELLLDGLTDEQPTTIPSERIIRELEAAGRELTIHEIAHRTGLSKQRVSDYLRPLVKAGDVTKTGRGVYKRVTA